MSNLEQMLDYLNVKSNIKDTLDLSSYYINSEALGFAKASIIILKDVLEEIYNSLDNNDFLDMDKKLLYLASIQSELFVSTIGKEAVSISIKNILASLSFINVVVIFIEMMREDIK